MGTDVLEIPTQPNLDIVKLNVTDTEIQKMEEEYLPLTINGIQDKEGLKKVYDSRQVVKRTRVSLVKYADDLKEKAIAWQRKVNAEKNRVVSKLEAIEEHLQSEEDKIAAEKEAIRIEAEKKEQERIQKRIDALAAYGYAIDYVVIQSIDDASFEKVLANAKVEYEKELAAKAEEEILRREEAQRLIAERKELEELRKQQAEAQRIIDLENERVHKEQEAKEKAIRDEQEKIALQQREIEMQKQREIEEKKRAEELEQVKIKAAEEERQRIIEKDRLNKIAEDERIAMASDKEKFQTVLNQLAAITIPPMKSARAKKVTEQVNSFLENAEQIITATFKIKAA